MPSASAGIHFALITVAIDAMGVGIIFPVMPDLLLSMGQDSVADAALWGGVLATIYALMQFLFSPVIGNLSDRYGRRPVLLVAMAAMAVDYIVLTLAPTLALLVIGRLIAGIAGATYAPATAYIADVSAPQDRAKNFGLVGAVFGVGFVLGPAIGGLVGEWHVRAPFAFAALMAAANCAFGFFFMPESLPADRRRTFEWQRANPLGALTRAFRLPELRWLLAAYVLFSLGDHVYPVIWSYWTKLSFDWSVGMIGASLALYGLVSAIVQGTLVGPSVRWFGDGNAIIIGLALGVTSAVGFAFTSVPWVVFAFIPIAALSDLAMPAITSVLSARVAETEQGELQGMMASCTAFAAVVAPPFATVAFYAATAPEATAYFPGAPFILAGIVILLAIPCAKYGLRRSDPGSAV